MGEYVNPFLILFRTSNIHYINLLIMIKTLTFTLESLLIEERRNNCMKDHDYSEKIQVSFESGSFSSPWFH